MAGLWKKFNPANDLYDQPLAYRGTIAPFGTYTNPDGSESAGFAWPGMITEPLNALQRLHENSYTEDGRLGIPNPQYQGNKDDVLTSLLSIYGGNALNPMAKVPANALASSAFKVEGKPGRPSIAGSAVAGAEAKGARPGPSALQPKAEAMGDGIIAETVDDAYRTFLSKLQDDPKSNPTFGPPTPGVDPTKVREAYEKGLQRFHSSFGKYSEDVPSPYGPLDGRLGDDLPAVMDALRLASEASGRQLKVLPRRYGSQYADLTTPTGDVWKVRVADHANQSVHHGGSDFNIAPGAMTQEQFLDLLPTIYSDTGRPSLAGAAVAAENAPTTGITAYHGSPHDFNRFDLSKIGTGEGAQAYGHGLYFAENEGVAKSYRDSLSLDGLGVVARGRLRQHNGDLNQTIEYLRGRVAGNEGNDTPFAVNARQALAELESAKAQGINPGHMYQVKINASPEDFLDWDLPLSQQSEKVRDTVLSMVPENDRYPNSLQGKDAVLSLQASQPGKFLDRSEVSPMLREAGIPGIKYLDQMSRAAGDGSRNYVVFDDSLIEILKKYGLAGGAIGASSLFDFNTENQF